jgi:hypothetical protein
VVTTASQLSSDEQPPWQVQLGWTKRRSSIGLQVKYAGSGQGPGHSFPIARVESPQIRRGGRIVTTKLEPLKQTNHLFTNNTNAFPPSIPEVQMIRSIVHWFAAGALLAQSPSPMAVKLHPQRPWARTLIVPLSIPLSDPDVHEGVACLKKALPTWQVRPAILASRHEVPRKGVTIQCLVDTEDGPVKWEFLFGWSQAGQMRLQGAKSLE